MLPSPSGSASRLLCQQCARPTVACLCAWVCTIPNVVEVLILQHPLEVAQAKGSVRLLSLCLQKVQILVGETFAADSLARALAAPAAVGGAPLNLLLYPDTRQSAASDLLCHGLPYVHDAATAAPALRLILIDATWRKSRKILYAHPVLQALPRYSLTEMPASHYRIRKAHKADQLSSLEACAYALMALENNTNTYLPLLSAFDRFIEQQENFLLQSDKPRDRHKK